MRKCWNAGLAAIVLFVAVAGCEVKVTGVAKVTGPSEVSEKPKPGKGVLPEAPNATPTPATSSDTNGLGHIQGRVFGNGGKSAPIPLAEVTANGQKVYAANPQAEQVFKEEPGNASQDQLSVMHVFTKGSEPELALRILRKKPPSATERYVYLRPGEFFLEGLTAAMVDVEAAFGGKTAKQAVRVMKDTVVEDVSLTVPLEEVLLAGPDGKQPAVVEWDGLEPANGISVAVVTRREVDAAGVPSVTTTLTYKPDPPDVKVKLKAPAGSAGATIAGYDVVYEYTTPKRQTAGQPPIQVGPTRVPMAPLTIPRSDGMTAGSSVSLSLPVGSKMLNEVWQGAAQDQPALILAIFEFVDDKGIVVPNKDLNTLKVSVPIRAL